MPEAIISSDQEAPELLETSLKLLTHLNPSKIEENLDLLGEAFPQLKESLRALVDVPSKIIVACDANNREFLSCEMTKSLSYHYRCPWDNKMYSLDGKVCSDSESINCEKSEELVNLEKALNEAVVTYASLYYGSDSVTSAYVEQAENSSEFTVAILIKKSIEVQDDENQSSSKATWDSAHLFEVEKVENGEFVYRHTATVILSFDNSVEELKNIKLAGNLIRQNEFKSSSSNQNHLTLIGSHLEECESRLRNDLQSVYFGRTHDIVNELRSAMPEGFLRNQADFRDEMKAKLSKGL